MHFYRYLAFFLFCLLANPFTVSGQNGGSFDPAAATYLWPTNASSYISSTFAETRSGHFHAALDLKTWGRRGYEVYATRDGWLHRIAIGPGGYGKVVYLKHDDGSYSLYAHLLRFEDSIQQIADSIRMQNYSSELDQTLDSLDIRVQQGDVIGISGATGIGPPHIHFELRTPNERPFNPLLTNLKVKDDRPPRFSRLSVEPLSPTSKIEGKQDIYIRRIRRGNTFHTIDVKGPVGLGIDVYDQANDVYNAYAVYELKMYVNNRLFFYSKVDSFGYHETDQMFLDRVYPILKRTRAGFQRLYLVDGNTLPFYQHTGNSGKLNLPEGTHQIRIVASDFYGNTSEANLRLRVHPSSALTEKKPSYPGFIPDFGPIGRNWTWYRNWVNVSKSALGKLTVAPLGQKRSRPANISEAARTVNIDLTQSRDMFFRQTSRQHFIARRIYPDRFSIVPATMHDAYVAFDHGTVYDTLSVGITHQVHQKDSVQVNVFPANRPIRKPFKLAYRIDSTQASIPNLSFYAYNKRKKRFSHLRTEKIGSYLVAYPDAMGTFYAFSDTLSPTLQKPRITRQADGKWVVIIGIKDNLSGVDHYRSVITVNGVQGIAEYEPEDDRLIYYHPDFQPQAHNKISVTVYDNEGNKKSRTFFLNSGS